MREISVDNAPKAIGPYSQAIDTGALVFLSGQIPLDPVTGQLLGADVKSQTAQALRNIEAVLAGAGLSRAHVVKTTVFLADMADFAAMNEVYADFFGATRPARSTIQAAALPRGALVEIESVALRA
jgi:2-iminobutanoate/2-iminopropanoate deaminase